MKNLKSLIFIVAVLVFTIGYSQSSFLNVATGSPSGTYSKIFKDMGKFCTSNAWLLERGTTGSLENIDLLLNNSVSMAFLQSDALEAKKQVDKDNRVDDIRQLIPLYREEVHIISLANLSITSGNAFNRRTTPVTSFSQLSGMTVGAWGGSTLTLRLLNRLTGDTLKLANFQNDKAGLAALDAGQVNAILAVGGRPLSWVTALPQGKYKLLAFDLINKVPPRIYNQTQLSYLNLSMDAVQTISVGSVLAVRNFRTPQRVSQLRTYRDCIVKNLIPLQEAEGTHPKWNEVDPKQTFWTPFGQ